MSQPSYLYGTAHSFDSTAFRFVPQLTSKIAAADMFGMELKPDLGSGANFAEVMQSLTLRGDTTLSMLLSPEEYERLSAYLLDSLGLPIAFFSKMKPFAIIALMIEKSMTKDAATFLDDSLARIAKAYNVQIVGIETVQEQLAAIDAISLRDQASMLMESVDSASQNSTVEEMSKFMEVYASGDLDSVYSFSGKYELQAIELPLIIYRNHRMADRIEKYLANKVRMFVAVGALHLPGDEGVINLLRKKGFTVTPIKLN